MQIGKAAEPVSHISQAYRSEEHTSELQSLITISYAVFCLKKKKKEAPKKTHVTRKMLTWMVWPMRVSRPLIRNTGLFFFFSDTATTEIYTVMNTLSLHDALPI